MKQKIHYLFMLLLMILTGVGGVKAQEVKYTISSLNTLSATGTAPAGSSATIAETYETSCQMTSGNEQTLTLKGYAGYKITKLVLSMKSNSKGGAGYLKYSVDGGNSYNFIISNNNGLAFNKDAWHGSWSTSYVNITKEVDIECTESDVVFVLHATANSLYCRSYTITYQKSGTSLKDAGLSFESTTATATIGETFTTPTLTNPHSLPVSYASSEETVATVNAETGAVTLVGAGTTTITASFAGNDTYAAGEASYELTVSKAPLVVNPKNVNSNYFVKVTDVIELEDGDAILIVNEDAKKAMGTTQNTNNRAASDVTIGSDAIDAPANDVQRLILVKEGDDNYYFYTGESGYLYAASSTKNYLKTGTDCDDNYKAKISYAEGNATITFQGSNSRNVIKYNNAETNGNLFSCYASTSSMQNVQIYKEVVKPVVAVEAPTFSVEEGTYYGPQTVELSCETEDATIYYTLDGSEPTAESTKYTGAISISETTTLKAIAIKDGQSSNVVSATYTIPTTYATIAAFKKSNTPACLNLTGAQVVYIDEAKKNIYVRDASAAICLYNSAGFTFEEGKELKAGDILSGTIYGKYSLYNNLPEITDIQNFDKLTVTDNTDVTPKAVASKEEIAANMCDLVKITKAQISKTDSKYYVLGVQLYDKLKLGYEPVTGVNANITGVVTDYKNETEIFPRTAGDIVYYPAAPTFSPVAGEVEKGTSVTITAEEGATLKYTVGEVAMTSASNTATVAINEDVTIKAVAVKDGVESEEVSAAYTVKAEEPAVDPGTPAAITAGFYTIKNLGNNQFVNVAGRKTVTFVDETATAPGTVIKVESNEKGQVQVLRSQGVDLPGYAERAMKYVPKIVQLVAEKLGAEGEGNLLGKDGLGKIMDKFNESFDYHLYTEQGEQGVRIYGKTPSMQPVVDFYDKNKANVDAKLPMLEDFINSAINKVLEKTGGSGASILTEFSLHEIWEKMGKTLTEPKDDASELLFLQQVLSNKQYVWDFAYQTAMKYWKPLISHKMVQQKLSELGDLAQYVEKIEYIRPDVKYYIVQKNGKIDFISQDNTLLKETSSEWELTAREKFTVKFDEQNVQKEKYYTTLYTDFAYTLPTGVKAMTVTKVAELNGKNIAITETIEGAVPAQTPVLLESATAGDVELTLDVTDGTAIENLLKGNDWLVNLLNITTPQVDKLFGIVHDLLEYENMGSLYDRYVKEYEYLKKRNAGTVNNKYFFALSGDDIAEAPGKTNVCQFTKDEQGLAFSYNLQQSPANKAFLPGDKDLVYLSFVGDVNRDGKVSVADVNALVEIVLGKVTEADNTKNYDFEAAHVNADEDITIADVTALVNIILGKTQN